MRIVTVSRCFEHDKMNFVAGHSYVMAEETERVLAGMSGAVSKSVPLDPFFRQYKGEPLDGKTLLVWRTGGNGDMLLLLPALQWLKKQYPTMRLIVATGCPAPLEDHPDIDRLELMPFDSAELEKADYHAMFQGLLEGGTAAAAKQSAVDLYMSALHIDPATVPALYKTPRIKISEQYWEWLTKTKDKLGILNTDVVVGVQIEASGPVRKFPKNKLQTVVQALVGEGLKVVIVGGPEQKPHYESYRGNFSDKVIIDGTGFSIRQSIILASAYSLIIAPDSMMIQVGAAYGIPTIGLYGPFHSSTRMKYHQSSIGLDARVVCSPCCIHDFRPCVKGFPSPCFTQISGRDIMEAAQYLLYPKYNWRFKCLVPEIQTSCPK